MQTPTGLNIHKTADWIYKLQTELKSELKLQPSYNTKNGSLPINRLPKQKLIVCPFIKPCLKKN